MVNPSESVGEDLATGGQKPPAWTNLFGIVWRNASRSAEEDANYRSKSTLGILSDKETDEVPGTILLLSSNRNEPLGLRHQEQRTSASSLPSPYPHSEPVPSKKKTPDGQIVLEPQPDDSLNDPLNWPMWRRDAALLSLGFYCLIGGGMTPILAAGFNNVAETYGVSTQDVAYTTGLYMLGLGVGSVIMSPTAILYGKRPVYLLGAALCIVSAVWCALSPNYPSLVLARIFQGIAVSPVECLPSATIAEIYFLHERAYRVGVYTLLLLGGKNLIPLVSAAIINSLNWHWVFWVVAMVVGGGLVLLFLFVPETFWDRTPRPRQSHKRPRLPRSVSDLVTSGFRGRPPHAKRLEGEDGDGDGDEPKVLPAAPPKKRKDAHVGFVDEPGVEKETQVGSEKVEASTEIHAAGDEGAADMRSAMFEKPDLVGSVPCPTIITAQSRQTEDTAADLEAAKRMAASPARSDSTSRSRSISMAMRYTNRLREQPRIPYLQTLKLWNGRIAHDSWLRVAFRPFILYAYPSVLWSSVVYSLSIGWLIVLSEVVAHVYQSRDSYNFSSIQTGLIYISPFVGALLGTGVAGKVSDIIVRFMARRNGGIYEPEFRLVMAIPIAVSTTIGMMGFGWSAQINDSWIVPTIFFGVVSFGCSLGSTTSITFCVDSYRQYAGEALVTLNFSKNVFHGLVFSLFIVDWVDADGARTVFLVLGGIQLACLLFTIPMYMYGKRARMWTVRRRLMERF